VVDAWYDLEHFFGLSGKHRKLSGIVVAKVVQRRIKFRLEFHELHCVPHAPNLRGRRDRWLFVPRALSNHRELPAGIVAATTSVRQPPFPTDQQSLKRTTKSQSSMIAASRQPKDAFPTMDIFRGMRPSFE
jgi:hypothetical protein